VRTLSLLILTGLWLLVPLQDASSFCGFYVSKAETDLFNRASKVVIARDGDRTVVTMANDFQGEARDFAVVIPVPTFLERGQVQVGNRAVIEHLDAYTAPRLVEYYDANPCAVARYSADLFDSKSIPETASVDRARALGVTVEASYSVGEYDILILSAQQSHGLETWLRENGYRVPAGASEVLASYLKQGMRFFVARVNLEAQTRLGFQYLRPLQVAYESPKFMLPIRLGTVNASGPQELFVFTLTRRGRVETTNYRTLKLPTGRELPRFVEDEFGDFYRAMFERQVERERMRAVFLEYAWDMAWCDPCAADPLSHDELRQLGVFWLADPPASSPNPRIVPPRPQAQNVFVTRLHVRYDAEHFPEDLQFQETPDRTNFQGRYVMRHPWTGEASCAAADTYREQLRQRQEAEARTLAELTGWDLQAIREKIPELPGARASDDPAPPLRWWERLWGAAQ
jgi:hypothetical protein